MTKNLMGKTRKLDNAYATFKGMGIFGDTEVRLLKSYQVPNTEQRNIYSRWLVAVKTDATYGTFEMGDSYVDEAVKGLILVECSDEYAQQYNVEKVS